MARATKAEKTRLLNAAYRLLGQRMESAEAARHLGREFALSRRQAYRYLQEAAGVSDPVPAVEPNSRRRLSTAGGTPSVVELVEQDADRRVQRTEFEEGLVAETGEYPPLL